MGVFATFVTSKGTKKWEVSPSRIADFKDLNTGFELNAETNDAIEGSPLTNQRGMKKKTLSFSSSINASLGVSVRSEFESWEAWVGTNGTLKIGGKKFGNKWLLTSVKASDVLLDENGRFRKMTLAFSFEEYGDVQEDVVATVNAKKSAVDVGPTVEDKNDKDTTGTTVQAGVPSSGVVPPSQQAGIIDK